MTSRFKAEPAKGGEGCGCERCREPLPNPPVQSPEEAKAKQDAYRAKRGYADREFPPIPRLQYRA